MMTAVGPVDSGLTVNIVHIFVVVVVFFLLLLLLTISRSGCRSRSVLSVNMASGLVDTAIKKTHTHRQTESEKEWEWGQGKGSIASWVDAACNLRSWL